MSTVNVPAYPSTVGEDDLDQLIKEVESSYLKVQPTPTGQTGTYNHVNDYPRALTDYRLYGSQPSPSMIQTSSNSRPRPLPPTPGTSASPRPSSADSGRHSRQLPTAPQAQPFYNSPDTSFRPDLPARNMNINDTSIIHPVVPGNIFTPLPQEGHIDDSSSIYPGDDTPALPVYVKDASSTFPTVPSYHDSQLSISNALPNPHSPDANWNAQPQHPNHTHSSSVHATTISDQQISPYASEPSPEVTYDQRSISELSYADSLPPSRSAVQNAYRQKESSRSPPTYPMTLPSTLARGDSYGSSLSHARSDSDRYFHFEGPDAPGPSNITRGPTQILRDIMYGGQSGRGPLGLHDDFDNESLYSEEEDDRFVNFTLLSHLAVQLRDKVPRGIHVKGSIPYPRAFTGKDIVSTIQGQIQRELCLNHGGSPNDRRAALQIARSLQGQLFFYEVEWGGRMLQDGVEDVYMFLDDQEGSSNAPREELPSGVVTILAKCYSPSCGDGECYVYGCPRKGDSRNKLLPKVMEEPSDTIREAWDKGVSSIVLESLPASEINRQVIIHKLISKEEQYIKDLDIIDSIFIKPLRSANPPVITPPDTLNTFIDEVFSNILTLRECNRRFLEVLCVRQREEAPVIQKIGDILLDIATEFRTLYPAYIGNHPLAERRMRDELENNPEFRLFIEKCSRQQSARPNAAMRLDLKHYLNRPSEHLQKYPVLLKAILNETPHGNPDADFLREAIDAIKNLQDVAQLRTFQSAMGKGVTGRWEWKDLVSPELRRALTSEESKRQSIIFELVKGEMAYVKDLENIESIYIRALRNTIPPIIPLDRLDQFIKDVFHNFAELHAHHRRLVDTLHEIQQEEHPRIRSVTAAVLDAVLNFREAYLEYIPNYPIAAYRIDEETGRNPTFKAFIENCIRHPDAHRMGIKDFLNCPIPRLLKYELLLKDIFDSTPRNHEDRDAIPPVIELIKALGRETEPGVASAKQKVQLWQYSSNLTFKLGETMDLDLFNDSRSLIHIGKLLRQPESGLEAGGWNELFVLLFDNYLVMTKPQQRDGVTKYLVTRRPIPLDLLSLVNFSDPPIQKGMGVFRGHRSGESSSSSNSSGQSDTVDAQPIYPWTIHHNGRLGGPYTVYTESAQTRTEWKQKLEEAVGLRKVVQEINKVFEVETLSMHTFMVAPTGIVLSPSTWNESSPITGKVTCSIPFNTPDGRRLVAVGCAEGIWIGFRHDSTSMRRVLHIKMVTQCTMLDDFGLFLVLADKQLFAYHIEALVPTPQHISNASQIPQKLSGGKEVVFFSTGKIHDRTFVIYMRKRGSDSYFHILEPVLEKIHDRPKAPSYGMFGRLLSNKLDWFKLFKEFFLPYDSFDLIFLKTRVAVLSKNGVDIMNLTDFKSTAIPQPDPRLAPLGNRYETCRPIGIFRSKEDEFILCYTEFGIYVNKQGEVSRTTCIVEWEGRAESVAFHAPYVLLFDPRFIEIRHVETGRLSQIIPGIDLRCVWDGRGLNSNSAVTPGVSEDTMVQEAHVHAVMNNHEPVVPPLGWPLRPVIQHVFELIPTIPLYLPGSLASPSTATYFPHSDSFSPPRSPHLRPSTSYIH